MDYPYPWLKSYPPGVPEHLEYPPVVLPDLLRQAARDYPEKEALSFYDNPVTYSVFYGYVSRFAAALVNLGVQKGDRVAIMGPNCPQWEIAFFGALMAGAVVVQTNPMYRGRELTFLFNDSGAKTVVVYKPLLPLILATKAATGVERVVAFDFVPTFQPAGEGVEVFEQIIAASPNLQLPPVDLEELAILQYTGGTTGDPKGVMLTHRNLVVNTLQALAAMTPLSPRKGEEVMLTVLPLFHVYGMTAAMNLAVALAAKQVILPRFEVGEVMTAIAKHRVTYFPGAPTMYVAVNNYPGVEKADISSVKGCLSGSAPLPPEVQRRFEELTGATLVEGYGLSEASPVTHLNPLGEVRRGGKIGLPVSDTVARIVDAETGTRELGPGEVGEMVVKGPQVMQGYWNKQEETAAVLRDGWLYTGDLATMDEDGFFAVVDRKKDLIIAGGFNIYPREVEDVIYEHPKVKEAAVVGISDPYRGETVKAFVVLKENESLSADELISFLREHIASFKVPRQVEFRSELPKTMVGKALRRVLREESDAQARKGEEV
ncbi:MAG TPA: long-chain fatty acid--CoA ligase [Spirochaetia bacterium]|nr:long-chain fatty acid--CoA ligase [Spirochaetia bacterium]